MQVSTLVAGIVFVLGAALPLAAAGETMVEQAVFTGSDVTGDCASYVLEPFSAEESARANGSVVVHFTNEGPATTGRVCLFDGAGSKRVDRQVPFAAGESLEVVFETAPGVYTYRAEFRAGGSTATTMGTMNTEWCVGHTEDVYATFLVTPDTSSSTGWGGTCVPGMLAVGLVGLVTSSGTFLLGKFPHLGAFLLYSRLAKPRLLDARVRQQVHDLVSREPGIHTREIVRVLDAGDGQIAHHLGVLAREKLLVSVGVPGFRHWFVTGRFSPVQMRAIATLRDDTRRRLYDAVLAEPGRSVTTLSQEIGISTPQASRAARALERAGLVERRGAGRALSIVPVGASPEAGAVVNLAKA